MATITYVIEVFDSLHKRYRMVWVGESIDWANKMFEKPYNRIYTRRLVKITREILTKSKGKDG